MLFQQHYSPTFFLLSSFLSPKRVIKQSFGYWEEELWHMPLSFLFPFVFLRCQVWFPGHVWQESLFAQNRKISVKQAWQISSFHSEDSGRYHSPAMCFRTWFEVPFFFPGNSSRGGGEVGSRGSEGCVGMTGGFALDVCIAWTLTYFLILWCDWSWRKLVWN